MRVVAAAALLAALAVPASSAQDGGGAGEGAVAAELRGITDRLDAINDSNWKATVVGLVIAGAAVAATYVYARRLQNQVDLSQEQVRLSRDHFAAIERDMRDRNKPRLAWTECAVGDDPDPGRSAGARAIALDIANAGAVGATEVAGHVTYGMAKSEADLGDSRRKVRMGAILPNATKRVSIPVEGEEREDGGSGYCFRFALTLWYSGVGNVRFEYRLVGRLLDREASVSEVVREVRG